MYVPAVQSDVCDVSALALKPETIKTFNLVVPAVWETTSTLSISVKWETPRMNGQFVKYQLCLLKEVLDINQEPNPLFCKEVLEVHSMNKIDE